MMYNGRLYRLYQNDMDNDDKVIHQLVILLSKRSEVLKEMHEGTLGGHLSDDKTLAHVHERLYWPGYHNDVCDWCKTHADCAAAKTCAPKNRSPLQSIKVGSPMQMVAVDIVGTFPESHLGYSYILVIGDYFTHNLMDLLNDSTEPFFLC